MALKPTEKMKRYRERLKESGGGVVQITLDKAIIEVIDRFRLLNGLSRNEVVEDILMTWACDTAEVLPELEAQAAKRNNSKQESKNG
jgi:hypothetical protein